MAKTSKKKTSKSRPATRSKAASGGRKKPVAKKSPTKKKAVTKKVTKKKAASKKVTKKKAAKKKATTKKVTRKKVTKKKSAKKAPAKKATTRKKVTKKKTTPRKKAGSSKAAAAKGTKKAGASRKKAPANGRRHTPFAQISTQINGSYLNEEHEPPTRAQLKRVKTGLSRKDKNQFRKELLERRAEIIGDVQGLEASRGGSGDISHMPLHMADVGSDNYEQEFTLGLMESERKIIIEIDEALQRMADGIYGVCLDSGKPIARARLEAKPWAKYSIEVARAREQRGL